MAIFEEIWNDVSLADIDKLGYTQDSELDLVSRYENEDVQKIYIAEKSKAHQLRFFNIIYNEDYNKFDDYTQADFNIIPKVNLSVPEFVTYTGGTMSAGMVCYAYQQYKKYGTETSFSGVSKMIPISKTIGKTDLKDIYGSDIEEDCQMGVNIKISNLDTNYSRVRVLAFDYTDYNSNPTIRIIYENTVEDTEVYITDDGSSLGTYDLSTFRVFNSFMIKPGILETKNNILFPGDIQEEYFDLDKYLEDSTITYNNDLLTTDVNNNSIKFYDSRIYRYDRNLNNSKIFSSDGTYDIVANSNPPSKIPYNHDCINKYNLVSLNTVNTDNPLNAYRYKYNSTELGGTGENINLSFATRRADTGETPISYKLDGTKLPGYMDYSYQRDEIYSLAIEFRDSLGRKSYPKWMLDCRMPNHEDYYGDASTDDINNFCKEGVFSSLYPRIAVTNIPKNTDGTYMEWRVLRCKREQKDKTVLGTAVVGALNINEGEIRGDLSSTENYGTQFLSSIHDYSSGTYYPADLNKNTSKIDSYMMEVISPDIVINNINIEECILQVVGAMYLGENDKSKYYYRLGGWDGSSSQNWKLWNGIEDFTQGLGTQVVKKVCNYVPMNTPLSKMRSRVIDSKNISPVRQNTSLKNIGEKVVCTMNYKACDTDQWAEHGTCAIAKMEDVFDINTVEFDGGHFFALIKKDTIPYGGNSYASRFNRTYIPASKFFSTTTFETCEYGDTHIGFFDYMRSQWADDPVTEDARYQEILYIPYESQIDLKLRTDESFSKMPDAPFEVNARLTEEGNVNTNTGLEITKLYQYNTVYSRQNDAEIAVPLPYDTSNIYSYDTRIRYSGVKFNGEYIDSWLKYLQNNYTDVDSQYGKLIDLKVYKNRLLFFQERGFGILPVGEKELLSVKDSATLALGTGGILNRFDYISSNIGISHKKALISTPNALYLYSNILNTLYRYGQNLTSLNDTLGMNSWFDSYVDNSKPVLFGYNPVMSEVLFQFSIYNKNVEILVYNEITNSFVYFYPTEFADNYKFTDFMTLNNSLYSLSDATGNYRGYKHNLSPIRNTIHGQTGKSSLDIIVAPQQNSIVTFNVLEFLTKLVEGNTNIEATVNNISVTNDYQDSGNITIIPTGSTRNIRKRFGSWRFRKLRDNQTNKPRIKSKYIKVHLDFENLSSRKLFIENITTDYSVSNIIY